MLNVYLHSEGILCGGKFIQENLSYHVAQQVLHFCRPLINNGWNCPQFSQATGTVTAGITVCGLDSCFSQSCHYLWLTDVQTQLRRTAINTFYILLYNLHPRYESVSCMLIVSATWYTHLPLPHGLPHKLFVFENKKRDSLQSMLCYFILCR